MINLIPPTGHKALKLEYALRVGATMLLLFAAIALLLTASLVPTYVLTRTNLEALKTDAAYNKDESAMQAEVEAEVAQVKKILAQLGASPTVRPASEIVEEIQRSAPATIAFKTFYISSTDANVQNVQIQGTAATRAALSDFKYRLESSSMFQSADVPIADLARESNLPFAISVTLAENK